MSYGLRIERVFDAPPELVFDTLVDPDAQPELFAAAVEGWGLWESEIDFRVGGTWLIVFGPLDRAGEPDRMTYVFTDIDRPRRLSYDASMYVSEWKRTIDFSETSTFEEHDGKTLLTIVQSGFESEKDRDAFMDGTPDFLDSLQRVVAARVTGAAGT
jgi:uncharacterized protein YndB with AHSA1/START domain